MKKLHLTQILLCLFILFIVSCSPGDQKISVPDLPKMTKKASVKDTISEAKFNDWTNAWESNGTAFSATTLLEYFTMETVDLVEVLGENPTKVRYHLGLDTSVTPNEAHLILVGVDAHEQDMLDYSKGQYAYDLVRPCPKHCPNKKVAK